MASDTEATSTIRKPSTGETSAGCAVTHAALQSTGTTSQRTTRLIISAPFS